MTDAFYIHVAGVVAVWMIFLSGLRFALAGLNALWPAGKAAWRLWRCREATRRCCRRRFILEMDRLHIEFFAAVTSPWSVTLLFGGMFLIGLGLTFASAGDVVQLVSSYPARTNVFDRSMDCMGALLICLGMASMLAGFSKRRTLSTTISCGFLVTGLGVGIVTAL